MIDQIIDESKPKMNSAIDNLKEDLAKIRTGRAHAGILDGIAVSHYGTTSLIKEVASVSVPESNMIVIKPWDRNALSAIETAIRASDLGLNPTNDGLQIRLVLPPMTEERRKEIAVQVKKQAKISLRNVRGEAWSKVQQAVKNKEATEDDKYTAEERLNRLTDEKNKEVDKISAEKEAEIMKI